MLLPLAIYRSSNQLEVFLPFEAAMVEVTEKVVVSLSYKDVRDATLPSCLLCHDDDGQRFLKVQASHPVICKLASGGYVELYYAKKNPSLSNSSQYGLLKKKLEEGVEQAIKEIEQKDGEDMFTGPDKKKTAFPLWKLPTKMEIEVGGTQVTVMTPTTRKQQDLWVLMEPSMLTAIFDWLSEDVEACFKEESKRIYKRKQAE